MRAFGMNRGWVVFALFGTVIFGSYFYITSKLAVRAENDLLPEFVAIVIPWIVAFIFALLGLLFLKRIIFKQPVLILDQEGLKVPLSFHGTIPWYQITDIYKYSYWSRQTFTKKQKIVVMINPSFSQTLAWRAPKSWFYSKRNEIQIYANYLDASPDEILAATISAWRGEFNDSPEPSWATLKSSYKINLES